MAEAKRGMDAVIAKTGRRRMMAKRKGPPGIAIMIAMGKPKPEMGEKMGESMEKGEGKACPMCGKEHGKAEMRGENLSKDDKVAALEEKIAYLKAELALLKDGEDDSEMESEDESEDEYEDD